MVSITRDEVVQKFMEGESIEKIAKDLPFVYMRHQIESWIRQELLEAQAKEQIDAWVSHVDKVNKRDA